MSIILNIRYFKGNKLGCWDCKKEYNNIDDLTLSLKCLCGQPVYLSGVHSNDPVNEVEIKYAKNLDVNDHLYIMTSDPKSYAVKGVDNYGDTISVGLHKHRSITIDSNEIVACLA